MELGHRWPGLGARFPPRINVYDTDYLRSFEPASPKRRDCQRAISAIVRRSAQRRLETILAILPDFVEAFGAAYPYRSIHETVGAWGQELGVETVDLLPVFAQSDSSELSVSGDGHPNAIAHQGIALALAPRIAARIDLAGRSDN